MFVIILCSYVCSSESHEGKTPSPSITRQSSIETDRVSRDFLEFLKTLQKPGREIHKQSRAFIESMGNKKVRTRVTCPHQLLAVNHFNKQNFLCHSDVQDLSAEELSECVQDFYQGMSDRLLNHFKGRIHASEKPSSAESVNKTSLNHSKQITH